MIFPSESTPWVLITGASAGIGETFAKRLARENCNLILVARSLDKLQMLAKDLESNCHIKTFVIQADLTERDSPRRVFEDIKRQGISLYGLINNAGCGAGGKFAEVELDRYLYMIDLNVRSLVELTHLFLPAMLRRKKGFIINVSSTASFQPMPYFSVYAATKAFVSFFSEALWLETKKSGVRVLNLCPGLTKTDFGTAAGMRDFRLDPLAEDPQRVVEVALNGLMKKNVPTIISGWHNRLLTILERLFPHRFVLWATNLVQNSRCSHYTGNHS